MRLSRVVPAVRAKRILFMNETSDGLWSCRCHGAQHLGLHETAARVVASSTLRLPCHLQWPTSGMV